MPELPEVETTRRGLAPYVVGRTIARVEVREPRLRWPVAKSLPRALAGARIGNLERRGKYLLFGTTPGRCSFTSACREACGTCRERERALTITSTCTSPTAARCGSTIRVASAASC